MRQWEKIQEVLYAVSSNQRAGGVMSFRKSWTCEDIVSYWNRFILGIGVGFASWFPFPPTGLSQLVAAPAVVRVTSTEDRMIVAVNVYRKKYNLPPLKKDPFLMHLAKVRAKYPTHEPKHLGWCWEHARKLGYRGFCTDNLILQVDYPVPMPPEEAVDNWATSTVGHNMQMRGYRKINGRWHNFQATKIGVARHGTNYIAIFGN
jgi:hypothetical protein